MVKAEAKLRQAEPGSDRVPATPGSGPRRSHKDGTDLPGQAHALQRTRGNRAVTRMLSATQVFDAAATGPRQALPYRAEMERAFGRDLGAAKVTLARPELRSIGAEAATRDDRLVFARPDPTRVEVAHELTHFIQNHPDPADARAGSGRVRPHSPLSAPGDASEREAESVARRAARGEHVEVHAAPTGTIARMLVGWELETNVPIYENGARLDHLDGYAEQKSDYAHENVDEVLSAPLDNAFEIHVDSSSTAYKTALNMINPGATMHTAEFVARPVASRAELLAKMKRVHAYLATFNEQREIVGGKFSMGWPVPQSDLERVEQAPPNEPDAPLPPPTRTVHARDQLETRLAADHKNTCKGRLFETYTQLTFQASPKHLRIISDLDTEQVQLTSAEQKEFTNLDTERVTRVVRGKDKSKTWVEAEVPVHPIASRDRLAAAFNMVGPTPATTNALDITVKIFKDALYFLNKTQMGTVKNSVSYLIRSDLDHVFASSKEDRQGLAGEIGAAIMTLKPEHLGLTEDLKRKYFTTDMKAVRIANDIFNLITDPDARVRGELEHVDENLRTKVETRASRTETDCTLPWGSFMSWVSQEVYEAVRPAPSAPMVKRQVTGPLHGSKNLGILPEADRIEPAVVFECRTPLVVNVAADELPENIDKELDRVRFPKW